MLPSLSPIAAIKPAAVDILIDCIAQKTPSPLTVSIMSGVISRKVILCAHWSECQTPLATKVSLYTVSQKLMLN